MLTIEQAKEVQRMADARDHTQWPEFKVRLAAASVILRHVSFGTYGQADALHEMAWALSVMAEGMYRALPQPQGRPNPCDEADFNDDAAYLKALAVRVSHTPASENGVGEGDYDRLIRIAKRLQPKW